MTPRCWLCRFPLHDYEPAVTHHFETQVDAKPTTVTARVHQECLSRQAHQRKLTGWNPKDAPNTLG